MKLKEHEKTMLKALAFVITAFASGVAALVLMIWIINFMW